MACVQSHPSSWPLGTAWCEVPRSRAWPGRLHAAAGPRSIKTPPTALQLTAASLTASHTKMQLGGWQHSGAKVC
jgi:hypothetical protein